MITLGIDLSTQSCTIVAVDCGLTSTLGTWSFAFGDSACVEKYGISATTKTLAFSEKGRHAQPPSMFLYALDAVLQTMKTQGFNFAEVAAVSVSAQQHGHVYLNGAYAEACQGLSHSMAHTKTLEEHFMPCYAHPYAPIWMTSNTGTEAQHFKTQVVDILERTGSDSPLRFTGAVIRKIATDYPNDYKATQRIHLLSSFLSSVLSAQPHAPIDYGNGAGTSLMHYSERTWDEALLTACALDCAGGSAALRAKLPSIDSPCALCGHIAAYFVHKYGFSPNCAVAVGSGDNPQTKALSPQPLLSLGSSFVMMSESSQGAESVVFHPHANAMYDALARPFLFACRTNGALVWDKARTIYAASIADGEDALRQISLGMHPEPMLWQPLAESFPASAPMPWTPTQSVQGVLTQGFYRDYACLVDTTLGLMAYATRRMQQGQYQCINLSGGLASSHEVCKRVSAFWNCPVMYVGSVGAGMGAAVCAAKAHTPSLNANELAHALVAHVTPVEATQALRAQAQAFTQRVQEYFENLS